LGWGLLKVVDEFLILVSIVDGKFEFSFFGPEDNRLAFHAADHVEGSFGLSAQRHLQQVFLDARFDGLAQLGGNFEVAIRRTQTFNALVRPLVVIIFDPEPDAFSRRLEAFELGAGEELLPDRFPEPLDLAQRHGMMGPGLEMVRPVLFHLGLEAGSAAPVDVLAPVVGEHLLGRLILAGRDAKHLQHVFGRVAAKQIGPHHEPGIVVHEPDQISVAPAQPEGEDVGLPHLIGRGPLEETRPHQVAPRLGRGRDQAPTLERLPNALRTGLEEEHPPQQLGYPFDAPSGFFLLELDDLLADRLGQPGPGLLGKVGPQTLLALVAVTLGPFINRRAADAQLLGDQLLRKAFLQVQLDRTQPLFEAERQVRFRRSSPRGGGGVGLLYQFILLHVNTSLSLKCQPI
jgi:hypothetical protein